MLSAVQHPMHNAGQNGLHPALPSQPRFASMRALDGAIQWVTTNLYGRGEGVRYAIEQTAGYTVPRTWQQFNRTRNITGEGNQMAAQEIFIRDTAADFTDTFLPGLLATYAVGKLIDKHAGTLVQHNIDHDALQLYSTLFNNGQSRNKKQFLQAVANTLSKHVENTQAKGLPATQINLDGVLNSMSRRRRSIDAGGILSHLKSELTGNRPEHKAALQLAQRLGLPDMSVTLKHNGMEWSGTLDKMLGDLHYITQKAPAQAQSTQWGRKLMGITRQTTGLKRYQMIANILALVGSISIPFAVRSITRHYYGKDAFPGSQEIDDFFNGEIYRRKHAGNQKTPPVAGKKEKFKWFPYLNETLRNGKIMPTIISLGFFAVLSAAVGRSFHINKLSPTKLNDWFKLYQFERGFPFTTVTQMELTYGALCGMRLLSSRNDSEFRETAVRDCLMGWPTLTYFFPWMREKVMAPMANAALKRQFGQDNILLRRNGELRQLQEITPTFLKNSGLGKLATQASKEAVKRYSRMTIATAAISCALLAWLEPLIGIKITNHFELAKHKNQPHTAKPQGEPYQIAEF